MKPPNKEIQYLNNNHHDIYIRYFSDDNVHIGSKLHRTSHKFTMYYKTKVNFFLQVAMLVDIIFFYTMQMIIAITKSYSILKME